MKLSIFILPFLAGVVHAADLYVADFSVAGQGSTHDTGGSDPVETSPVAGENWSMFWDVEPASDGSTNSFITEGGLLISDDWGGEAFFETEEIDVSGESTINIEAIAATRGAAVFNSGAEGFMWYYILDGTRIDAPLITSDGSLDFSEEVDVSAASTLVVGFTFTINGAGDGFEVVSLEVNDGVPTPEISLALDSANLVENGPASTVTITLSIAPVGNLTLDVLVDDTSEASAPLTVTIPSGMLTGSFSLSAVDDALSDGPQVVALSVTDPGGVYEGASEMVVVSDDEAFTPASVILNEIRINSNTAFTGNGEYFELKSTQANASLDRIFLVAIGDGTAAQGSGVVEEIIDLSGQAMNGNLFVAADPDQNFVSNEDYSVSLNFENSNVTFLLVSDFAAVLGADLDADDDGTLDSAPWGVLLDAVSLVSSDFPTNPDLVYAGTLTPAFSVVGPDSTFIPAHIFRSSTNSSNWLIGTFFADGELVADTPGAENGGGGDPPSDDVEILSFSLNQAGTSATIVATGLGAVVWKVQSSDDLGNTDPWADVSGVGESDNPDGSTNFSFSPAGGFDKQFYRLIEQ